MTDNSKLVNFFVANFLADDATELAHLVSPTFTYYLNFGEPKDFSFFTNRMNMLNLSARLKAGEITSGDDIHFHYDIETKLPAPNTEIAMKGFAQIIVKNNLIQQLEINYEVESKEYEKFEGLINASPTVLL